jgi:hypothetical protein
MITFAPAACSVRVIAAPTRLAAPVMRMDFCDERVVDIFQGSRDCANAAMFCFRDFSFKLDRYFNRRHPEPF